MQGAAITKREADRFATSADPAGVGPLRTSELADQSGLAGSVGTQDAQAAALGDRNTDILKDDLTAFGGAVRFVDAIKDDHE